METLESIDRLRTLMRRLALLIGLTTAVSIPAGFVLVSYHNALDSMAFKAQLSANRLSQYVYLHGPTWRYSEERLHELISFTAGLDNDLQQTVRQSDGDVVLVAGPIPSRPRLRARAAIMVGGDAVGEVEVVTSMLPIVLEACLVALFAAALGGGAYLAMHSLPLRAPDRTLERLQQANRDLESHATETTYAYEELQRQYCLVEETTQDLMIARDEARSADRTKSAFLATMSHELRTPLNAIIGFSEMLRSEIFGSLGDARYSGYAADILVSGHHLLAIINNILDLSKIEAGMLKLHVEPVALKQLLKSCCRLVNEGIEEAGVELQLVGHSVPALLADPVKLKQIILNLLSNAIKFTPRGGRITLSATAGSDHTVSISVTDTGIGMTPEDVDLALQPFQQVDNGHTRRYEGTGLGLPLAKALTEQHRGSLSIASEAGKGTRVTVTLPADHRHPAAAAGIAPHEAGDESEFKASATIAR